MLPFNRASIVGKELEYIHEAVNAGVISGEGHFARKCEALLKQVLATNSEVILTSSCTAALEMCALLLNLSTDDEVIMPSYTFVSTANAFALRGARPVFVDVERDSLNINPQKLEQSINARTKAIVLVHYAGFPCEMDTIMDIAKTHKIPVIEDAAHALASSYKGKALGTFGAFATFSFHETKNVTCGEGGALVINDHAFVSRAHIIKDKGTNRREFQRGDAPFYSWVDLGSSYVISDILGAFLYAQLEHLDEITNKRRELYAKYAELLKPLKNKGCLDFPEHLNLSEASAHIFYILLKSKEHRDRLRKYLLEREVLAVFHYQPLHESSFVVSRWGKQPSFPVTEDLADRLLRLPMFYSLEFGEQERVAEIISDFFQAKAESL